MKKSYLSCAFALALLASCEVQETEETNLKSVDLVMERMVAVNFDEFPALTVGDKVNSRAEKSRISIARNAGTETPSDLQLQAAKINELLVPYGVQIEKMEYYTADEAGRTVFFSDTGNKQLSSDYVPNDPRQAIPGTAVPYVIDGTQLTTSSGFNSLGALNSVMSTWDAVTCSGGLELPLLGITGNDVGFVSNAFGFGGSEGFFPGIILQAGVLPQAFFEAIRPNGGGTSILGVTFTLTYLEDINADGVGDVAVKEIYYNDAFNWQDVVAAGFGVDFETVALHEVGHALSQAHFGKVSRTESNGKIHFSPRALMNAGYSGVNRVVEKTDEAGHCSNWGNWPNN